MQIVRMDGPTIEHENVLVNSSINHEKSSESPKDNSTESQRSFNGNSTETHRHLFRRMRMTREEN